MDLMEVARIKVEAFMKQFNLDPKSVLVVTSAVVGILVVLKSRKQKGPPGPTALPLIGNYLQLRPYIKKRQLYKFFLSLHQKYGRVATFVGLNRRAVLIADASEAKRILSQTEKFKRDDLLQRNSRGMFDHALFVMPTGDVHQKHRKFLTPAFSPNNLKTAEPIIESKVVQSMEYWNKIDTEFIDIHNAYILMTMDIIGLYAFGVDFDTVANAYNGQKIQSIDELSALTMSLQGRFVFPEFMWKWLGVGLDAPHIVKSQAFFRDLLGEVIEKREKKVLIEANTEIERNWNVLDRLLYGNLKEQKFTKEELAGEIMGFFAAGHETTSSSLTWITLELARNPKCVTKLQKEVDAAFEAGGDVLANIFKLEYLENFIKETQRVHSVVAAVARYSTENVNVAGYDFPKGSRFSVSIIGMHNDPEYFKDPDVFNPDRFDEPIVPGSFLPFGDGQMKCIGFKLALLEMKIIIAYVVRNYNAVLKEGQDLEGTTALTTSLRQGLFVKLLKRNA